MKPILLAGLVLICGLASAQMPDPLPEDMILEDRSPLRYDHIRESDVMWEKRLWRVIDFKEKMNKPFIYPRAPFYNLVVGPALSNELTVYRDEDFSEPFTLEGLNGLLNKTDTFWDYNDETGITTPVIFNDPIIADDISKLRIKEDWIFDEEASRMVVRIIGIAFIRDVYDDNDEFLGEEPLFWLHYPTTRNLLAKRAAFNPYNDKLTSSWDDIFEMRMFSSYIIKESNVHDRRISEYAAGMDMVIESERIHESIRRYEHELWSY